MPLFFRICVRVLLITGCNSQKSTIKKSIEEYKKEGYTLGIIEAYNSGDCTARITVKKSGVQYDPTNIKDDKFAKFVSTKTEIYFKFLPLRRMNRCEGISPIQLINVIQK